jgi:hypothetical protein
LPLVCEECPSLLQHPPDHKALGALRVKTIKNLDKTLTWAFAKKNSSYALAMPLQEQSYSVTAPEILGFEQNYGFFSPFDPLAGKLTADKADIQVAECLLKAIDSDIQDAAQKRFSLDEVLAKVLAYRALEKGMELALPQPYLVDEVIDLWRGMPAFGLAPKDTNSHLPAILLFRGTDFSFSTEKGWASIMSDLDIQGPGLSTFLKARPKIHSWLLKMKERGQSARVIGVSLGGVLASYAYMFEKEDLSHEPSVAINPPGMSEESYKVWAQFPKEEHPSFLVYVTKGAVVSKIGYLIGTVKELQLPYPLKVIEAHVTLISTHKRYSISDVDLAKENATRRWIK